MFILAWQMNLYWFRNVNKMYCIGNISLKVEYWTNVLFSIVLQVEDWWSSLRSLNHVNIVLTAVII